MHSSFLYLIFPYSILTVQYNITMKMNKFFRFISLEFFRMFSKPFSHSSLNFFNHMQINSFKMFLQSCKQPAVRRCHILTAGKVWNNLKSNIIYHHWHGSTSERSGVIMFKKHRIFFLTNASDLLFHPLQGLHVSWTWLSHFWPCTPAE